MLVVIKVPGVTLVGLPAFTTRLLLGLLRLLLVLFDYFKSAALGSPACKADGVLTPTPLARSTESAVG